MRYSNKDLILFFISLIQFIGLSHWCVYFHGFSLFENVGLFIINTIVFYFNPIVITHNFLHTPFFKSDRINNLFTIFNSMNLGLPQILYKYHHLTHHRYNNGLEDPSSTYLYGKNGQQENWIKYSALGLFRDGTQKAWAMAIKKGEKTQLYLELVTVVGILVFWSMINYSWMLSIYLPLFFVGWFLAHLENYYEHYKATDKDDRHANSVSFYNKSYNILMFNEGYHQEHHCSPQTHWTKRPEVHQQLKEKMEEANYYVSKYPPLLGMFE